MQREFEGNLKTGRMAEGTALLVDEVLLREPLRPWVLSIAFALRYLLATAPAVMGGVLDRHSDHCESSD